MNLRRARCFVLLVGVALGISLAVHPANAQPSLPPLMPMPAHIEMGDGQFPIDRNLNITFAGTAEPRLLLARERFMDTLSRQTGIPYPKEKVEPAFELHHPNRRREQAGPGTGRGRILPPESLA